MAFTASILIAYLIGSISCAIIVAKILKLPDPRTKGSGNAGATNMWRLAGKKPGLFVLLGDALKGAVAVLIGRLCHLDGIALGLVAVAVVLGHVYPLYFRFKGGKGIATLFGALIALSFWVGIFVIVTWIIIALILRYSSLASLVAAVAAPVYLLIDGRLNYFFPILLLTALVIWKHWGNIKRLREGTERKIHF